jgi:hypothetical protein
MGRRLHTIAGLILLLLAVPYTVFGIGPLMYFIVWDFGACDPAAPICRSMGVIPLLLGGFLVGSGAVHAVIGIGVLRRGLRAHLLGILMSAVGVAVTACVGLNALEPLGYVRSESGSMEPFYHRNSLVFAAGLVP